MSRATAHNVIDQFTEASGRLPGHSLWQPDPATLHGKPPTVTLVYPCCRLDGPSPVATGTLPRQPQEEEAAALLQLLKRWYPLAYPQTDAAPWSGDAERAVYGRHLPPVWQPERFTNLFPCLHSSASWAAPPGSWLASTGYGIFAAMDSCLLGNHPYRYQIDMFRRVPKYLINFAIDLVERHPEVILGIPCRIIEHHGRFDTVSASWHDPGLLLLRDCHWYGWFELLLNEAGK